MAGCPVPQRSSLHPPLTTAWRAWETTGGLRGSVNMQPQWNNGSPPNGRAMPRPSTPWPEPAPSEYCPVKVRSIPFHSEEMKLSILPRIYTVENPCAEPATPLMPMVRGQSGPELGACFPSAYFLSVTKQTTPLLPTATNHSHPRGPKEAHPQTHDIIDLVWLVHIQRGSWKEPS